MQEEIIKYENIGVVTEQTMHRFLMDVLIFKIITIN